MIQTIEISVKAGDVINYQGKQYIAQWQFIGKFADVMQVAKKENVSFLVRKADNNYYGLI